MKILQLHSPFGSQTKDPMTAVFLSVGVMSHELETFGFQKLDPQSYILKLEDSGTIIARVMESPAGSLEQAVLFGKESEVVRAVSLMYSFPIELHLTRILNEALSKSEEINEILGCWIVNAYNLGGAIRYNIRTKGEDFTESYNGIFSPGMNTFQFHAEILQHHRSGSPYGFKILDQFMQRIEKDAQILVTFCDVSPTDEELLKGMGYNEAASGKFQKLIPEK